jgi:hypothetical protein
MAAIWTQTNHTSYHGYKRDIASQDRDVSKTRLEMVSRLHPCTTRTRRLALSQDETRPRHSKTRLETETFDTETTSLILTSLTSQSTIDNGCSLETVPRRVLETSRSRLATSRLYLWLRCIMQMQRLRPTYAICSRSKGPARNLLHIEASNLCCNIRTFFRSP